MTDRPNIVLIILDSARSDMFGCYGNPEGLTPHIDAWAREALVCRNNYSAGNGSAMGHTGLFSGQHAARHQMVHNLTQMPTDLKALPTMLKPLGYKSYGHLQVSFIPPAGYEDLFGFDELRYPGKGGKTVTSIFSKKNILEFLRSRPKLWQFGKKAYGKIWGDRRRVKAAARAFDGIHSIRYLLDKFSATQKPIFAYTTLMHPHTPYYPPDWCIQKVFGRKKIDKMAFRVQLDFHGWVNGNYGAIPEAIDSLKKLYQAELVYADFLVGQFIAELKKRGDYENTIVILASDHGEYLGEHGWLNHGYGVWDELYRTPLIISYPKKITTGKIIDDLTSNLDVVPTVLDLVGSLDSNVRKSLDGIPLSVPDGLLRGRRLVIDSPPVVLPGRLKAYSKIMAVARTFMRAVVTKEHKYIWSSDGKEFLFPFRHFESESNNILSADPDTAQKYREHMLDFYRKIHPNFELEHYPLKLTQSLGNFGNPLIVEELKKLGYL